MSPNVFWCETARAKEHNVRQNKVKVRTLKIKYTSIAAITLALACSPSWKGIRPQKFGSRKKD